MAVLGSGSGGNAVVVTAGGTRLLLDAGLSAKQLRLRLEMVGVEPDSLDGILLSHEHGDHVRGLDVFLRKHRVPVFATALTREVVQDRLRGRVEWRHVVAVVGSRKATAYGRKVARLIGEELARSGVVVASGMARGVDAAAHHGALAGGGRTVAIWGTGPDEVYPRDHVDLAEAIAAAGGLVTEYPPGTPPRRHHFPQRNRILAGIADAVVVVEAAARSGALVTARLALDEGREVFAVPGSIFSEVSLGPNALLRLGAQPLLVPRDVLDAVGVAEVSASPRGADELDGILEPGDELTVDELARRRGVDIQEMLATLLELELAGGVERLPDGRYCRR